MQPRRAIGLRIATILLFQGAPAAIINSFQMSRESEPADVPVS